MKDSLLFHRMIMCPYTFARLALELIFYLPVWLKLPSNFSDILARFEMLKPNIGLN